MHENVTFKNRYGQKLAGVLHLPGRGRTLACAVFAHCFTCTKNIAAARNIAQALADRGIAVLRFDFTGLGRSEGEFADTHFSSNIADLVDAASWMSEHHHGPRILVGHSLGGTAVLAAAHEIDSVRAVATIGSPADAEHVLHLISDDLETIEREGRAEVRLGGVPFTVRKSFIDNVRSQSVRDGIAGLRRALLVMHSPRDTLVPIEEAGNIYAAARHPKSFVSLDDADHLLTEPRDSQYAADVLAAWASRYALEDVETPRTGTVPGAVVAEGRTDEGFLTALDADGHHALADEPVDYGGSDFGPTPYEYLAASLGSCTVMTLNVYARHKKLALESVRVEVRHERIHAEDCDDCEGKETRIDRFRRRISVRGALAASERQRLLEMADRCPVHRTLEGRIVVESELADD